MARAPGPGGLNRGPSGAPGAAEGWRRGAPGVPSSPRILGDDAGAASLPGVTTRLYITLDLALLAMVVGALVVVDQEPVWIAGLAAIWLALSASWLLLDAWWRRSG